MRQWRKLKPFSLVMAIIMMAGLIILAGCGGGETTSSGTSGDGAYDQSSSSSSGGDSNPIELEVAQLTAVYSSYIGKTVIFQATVDSKTDSYVIADSIKCVPSNPADIESLEVYDMVQVTGIVQGMSGGVITVNSSTIVGDDCED